MKSDPVRPSRHIPAKKRPFSVGWKFLGEVVNHPAYGIVMVSDRPPAFLLFELAPGSGIRKSELVHRRVSVEVAAHRRDVLILRLIEPPPKVRRELERPVVVIPAERISKREVILEFAEEGTSELERMAAANDPHLIERIETLAMRKDDPSAWWSLALGHRARQIRIPVEQALIEVGIERIERMIRQNPNHWGVELLDFVDAEIARQRVRGPRSTTSLPGDLPGWDKPWWADD